MALRDVDASTPSIDLATIDDVDALADSAGSSTSSRKGRSSRPTRIGNASSRSRARPSRPTDGTPGWPVTRPGRSARCGSHDRTDARAGESRRSDRLPDERVPAPAHRNGGARARMLEQVLDWCRAQRYSCVVAWPTPRSRTFYRRGGFDRLDEPVIVELRPDDAILTPAERVEERAELALGLLQLRRGIGAGDDPGARVQDRAIPAELGAPERDRPVAVAVRVDPSDRAGVATAVERLRARRSRRARRRSAFPRSPASGGAPRRGRARSVRDRAGSRGTSSRDARRSACRAAPARDPASSSQNGPRTSATASTTIACSSRSFAEDASFSALARSSSRSPERGAEPARGFERTSRPCRDTRSSGDAPTITPSSVGAANV